MSARKGLFTGGIAMLARASNQLFLIGVTLVATRYLSPTDFGVFALATAFVTLARTLLYAGPFEYLMKARDLEQSASEALAATSLLALVGALTICAIGLFSGRLFGSAQIAPLMFAIAPTLLIAAFASWEESLLLREGRLPLYYATTMAVELLSSATAVVLLLRGHGLFALIAQNYLRVALLAIGYRVLVVPVRLHRPERHHLFEILRWSVARYGSVMVGFLSNYSGDLVMGVALSPAATGLYRAGNRIVTAVSDVFTQPAGLMAMTSLATRSAAGHPADGRWVRIFAGVAFLGWPCLAGACVLGNWIAPILLGPQWSAVGPVISLLAIAKMASLLSTVAANFLVVQNRQHLVFWTQAAGATGVVVLTLSLARFEIVGAAVASAVVLSLISLTLVTLATRLAMPARDDIRDVLSAVVGPLVCTTVGAIAGRRIAIAAIDDRTLRLIVAVGFGGAAWFVAVMLLRRPILRCIGSLRPDAVVRRGSAAPLDPFADLETTSHP